MLRYVFVCVGLLFSSLGFASGYSFESLDVDMILLEGTQYVSLTAHLVDAPLTIAETEFTELNSALSLPEVVSFKMFYMGGKQVPLIALGGCVSQTDYGCQKIWVRWFSNKTDEPLLSCEFEIGYARELYWLKGFHNCDQEIPVYVENDNS